MYIIWSLEIHLVNTYDHHLSPSSNMQIEQKNIGKSTRLIFNFIYWNHFFSVDNSATFGIASARIRIRPFNRLHFMRFAYSWKTARGKPLFNKHCLHRKTAKKMRAFISSVENRLKPDMQHWIAARLFAIASARIITQNCKFEFEEAHKFTPSTRFKSHKNATSPQPLRLLNP